MLANRLAALLALATCAAPTAADAQVAPSWWPVFVVPGNSSDDSAPVNFGQLKNFAVSLYDHLQANFPGGVGSEVDGMVKPWFELEPDGSFKIEAHGHRIPKPAGLDNFAAVNFGQLKQVAKPFYDRLMTHYYVRACPWEINPLREPPDSEVVNLGEVKKIFALDIVCDTDGDGLPDLYELATGLNPSRNDAAVNDSDGDGVFDLDEFHHNTDPLDPGNGAPFVEQKDGDNQEIINDSLLDHPLLLRLLGGPKSTPAEGVPITFTTSSGSFARCDDDDAALGTKTANITNRFGEASVQFRCPEFPTHSIDVTATYFHDGRTHTIAFHVPYVPQDADEPADPTRLHVELVGPVTRRITWKDNSDDEDGFIIEYRPDVDRPWVEIGRVSPDTTEFLIENPPDGPQVSYQVYGFKYN